MKNTSLVLGVVAVSACLFLGLACGMFGNQNGVNSSNSSNVNSNATANISTTPVPTPTLPTYTAGKLAEFLKAEYQKPGGKDDPNAGLKDKQIVVSGNVSLVNPSEVDFFVDQTTLVRCQGPFYSDKDYPALESYHRDNVSGTTKLMPSASVKGLFSRWGASSKKGETEIVLTGCQVLSASRL